MDWGSEFPNPLGFNVLAPVPQGALFTQKTFCPAKGRGDFFTIASIIERGGCE